MYGLLIALRTLLCGYDATLNGNFLVVKIHSFLLLCNGSKIISYHHHYHTRTMETHATCFFTSLSLSLSLSLRSALRKLRECFWSHKDATLILHSTNISFPDRWRFGIEHVCTSGRTLSAWLIHNLSGNRRRFVSLCYDWGLLSESPREFAWFAR